MLSFKPQRMQDYEWEPLWAESQLQAAKLELPQLYQPNSTMFAPITVSLIGSMGNDLTVVNAARVSFDKQHDTFDTDKDTRLINYLAKHGHWTPFAHCFAQFRIKAPIFVARQLVKHQVGLVWNEVSRRYVDSEPEFWLPSVWRGRPSGSMKQGSHGVVEVDDDLVIDATKKALALYSKLIDDGVAPEQARLVLPQGTMTEWYWSGSLAAFARVCKQRLDPHAQEETREVAQQIAGEMQKLFPVSWTALMTPNKSIDD